MKQYPEVKDSGVRWVGKVPRHWAMERIKRILYERKESNSPIKTMEILSLTNARGVIPYSQKGNIGNKSKDNIEDYHLAYPDDLVINSMNVVIGSAGLSKYFGAISPVYYALVSRGQVNIKFCEYIFRLSTFEESIKGLGNGILDIRKRIPMIRLNDVLFPVPPLPEQDQIVRFLDWKVSEINRLTSLRKKQIAALEELKKSVISKAIIGEKIWLKRLLSLPLQYGANLSGIEYSVDLPRYIRITDIDENGQLKLNDRKSISSEENSSYILSEDDILLARSGATAGKAFLYKKEYGLCVFAGYLIRARLNFDVLRARYFMYFTESIEYFNWKNIVFIQATIQNISAERYNKLPIPVPPLPEQDRIVAYLDEKTSKINAAIDKKKQQIELSQELKTRLISDVVTGKIDVRDVKIPEYEYTEAIPNEDTNEKEVELSEEAENDE